MDIFSKVLDNRFPENRILSHDLLEGCYTRCGLLSDVQLYEEYPLHYNTDVKRRHRWIRGDWQIGAWLLPLVPGAGGRWERNHLSALSRWKIFDNLRRSLVPASLLFLLLSGWIILHAAWFWTISVIAMILLPQLVATAGNLLRKPKDISTAQHFRDSLSEATGNFLQTIFTIICLPYEAYYTLDAILRTNWRMIISRKKLLEWNPSHQKPNKRAKTLVAAYSLMWFAPITGIGMLVYITVSSPISLVTGIPVLFLWIAAPGIAWWVSLSKPLSKTVLKPEQAVFLRKLARKIWGFFEIFVGEEDNWLPPDNFQEHPVERIAHRTSPTNIGLSLLSNLSAWDFGYITTGQLIERTGNTLGTLQKLERFHGHLFNWYDTKTLHPLPPRYISTVDSGNLAGHLITLYNGLRNAAGRKIITRSFFEGLGDTLDLLQDELSGEFDLAPLRLQLEQAGNDSSLSLFDVRNRIEILQKESSALILQLDSQKETEAYYWSRNLLSQCSQMIKEINELVPAPLLVPMPEKFKDFSYFTDIPTLRELSVFKETLADRLLEKSGNENTEAENNWLDVIESCSEKTGFFAREKLAALENLAAMCLAFADIDYEFLFDRGQKLLTIGYNVEDHRKDPGSYDLLASEARLGTFVGIAQGKLPQESWFALGRQLTNRSGTPVLLSWSGSMFEYLMPLLVMPDYDNTLLNHTYKAMVDIQIN